HRWGRARSPPPVGRAMRNRACGDPERKSGGLRRSGGRLRGPIGRASLCRMSHSPAPSPSRPARIFLAAMGAVLVVAGLGFTWGLIIAWRKAEITRGWVETPCAITASGIEVHGAGIGRHEW